jgi:hypothetical protein
MMSTTSSRSPIALGVTVLTIEVANVASPEATERLEFIVDSGAVYSVVPAPVLERLGILPLKQAGALTLESLGLSLDPIRRELKPMDLIL